MKKVLITGATGFIGKHLVKANLRKKNKVRVLVREGNPAIPDLKKKGVEVFIGDIMDYNSVFKAAKGIEIFFHLAGTVTDWATKSAYEVNIKGTENACRAATDVKVKRFVMISTNDVFGRIEGPVIDESFPLTKYNEPYPDTKLEATKICHNYYEFENLPVTMVYPCWVYGEGDTSFIPPFADAVYTKDLIFWRKDVTVWPTYIDNLIDIMMLISEDKRAVGHGYLVHDGESTTLQELCRVIAKTLNVPPINTHIPYFAAYAAGFVMEIIWRITGKTTRPLLTTYAVKNLGSRLKFSIAKAERELGWKPKISYKEGLKNAMEWLNTMDIKKLKVK